MEMLRAVPFAFELTAVCFATLIPPYVLVLYQRRWRLSLSEALLAIALVAGILALGVQESDEVGGDYLLYRWSRFWGFVAITGIVISALSSYACHYLMRRGLSRDTRTGRWAVLAIGIVAFGIVSGVHVVRAYNAWVIPRGARYARRAALAPDGRTLVVSDGNLKVEFLRLPANSKLTTLMAEGSGPITALLFSPDGATLVAVGLDGIVTQWGTADWMPTVVFRTADPYITSVTFSPDGRTLATGHSDGRVRLWNTTTGQMQSEIEVSNGEVCALRFLPARNSLAAADTQGFVQTFDIVTDARISRSNVGPGRMTFSPHSDLLAVAEPRSGIRIWDLVEGARIAEIRPSAQEIRLVRFSGKGELVAIAADGYPVEVYSSRTAKRVSTIHEYSPEIDALVFTDGNQRLVTVCRDWTARYWDVATGTMLRLLEGSRFAY